MGMLQWPHSGFHVHAGVGVSEDDRPFALSLARYCARKPLALDRLNCDPATEQLTYRSDETDGPTAGTAALDPLELLSRSGDDALLRLVREPDQEGAATPGGWGRRGRGARRDH